MWDYFDLSSSVSYVKIIWNYGPVLTLHTVMAAAGTVLLLPATRHSVRAGSVLHKRTAPFSTFIHLIWLFCSYTNVTDAARILSMNYKTVRTIFQSIRQCMAKDLLDEGGGGSARKIGGPGHIIEVDECKFGKRKYNRGRRVVGKWILGGCSGTTNECFLVECPHDRRDHHTLLRFDKGPSCTWNNDLD